MDAADDRIVIPSSRAKLVLMFLGSLLFTAGSVVLFEIAETQDRYPPLYVKAASILGVAFFGLCAVYIVVKLLDGAPGLVLDREGIIDNSSGVPAGRVAWEEVRDIRTVSVKGQRFLALVVDHPERYLGRGGVLRRLLVRMNFKLYGSPVCISAHALRVSFDELERVVREFHRRNGA